MTIARCGSQSVMSAPISTSLSVKNMRFSNIHSWMSTEPSHCVASATAIDVRSAGNAGHGPSWTFALYSPTSRCDDQLLAAGDDHVVAVELGLQPELLEDQADHPQVVGVGVVDPQLAAGHAGERHERADLDVVGADRRACSRRARRVPVTVSTFEPMPLDVGAHLRRASARGPGRAARRRRCRSRSRPASARRPCSAFSVAMTDGSSMKTSPARRPPPGASITMSRSCSKRRAERARRRRGAGPGGGGRSRRRRAAASSARPKRASSGPASRNERADALGVRAVDRRASAVDVGGAQRDLVVVAPLDA